MPKQVVAAHRLSLRAFGSDSLIEFLSAMVVLLQFLPRFRLKKLYAERAAGAPLDLLAVAILCVAWIDGERPVQTSRLGIAITVLALVVMPVLARLKRRQARILDNRALEADATLSATCRSAGRGTLAGGMDRYHSGIGRRAWRSEACGSRA